MKSVNIQKPVQEIVTALHKAEIPLDLLDKVFEAVKRDIMIHTVPYNPSLEDTNDLATSETTDTFKRISRTRS